MMLSPTVDRFFGTRFAVFLAGRLALVFVFIEPSYFFPGYPATSIGTNRFIALRSALLRSAFSFFG